MTTPIAGLTELIAAQSQPHVPVNAAMRALEILGQLTAASITSDPPGSPTDGLMVIVGEDPTGYFENHRGHIAYYAGGWKFLTPRNGWLAYVQNQSAYYTYDGGSPFPWSEFVATSEGGGGGEETPQILLSLQGEGSPTPIFPDIASIIFTGNVEMLQSGPGVALVNIPFGETSVHVEDTLGESFTVNHFTFSSDFSVTYIGESSEEAVISLAGGGGGGGIFEYDEEEDLYYTDEDVAFLGLASFAGQVIFQQSITFEDEVRYAENLLSSRGISFLDPEVAVGDDLASAFWLRNENNALVLQLRDLSGASPQVDDIDILKIIPNDTGQPCYYGFGMLGKQSQAFWEFMGESMAVVFDGVSSYPSGSYFIQLHSALGNPDEHLWGWETHISDPRETYFGAFDDGYENPSKAITLHRTGAVVDRLTLGNVDDNPALIVASVRSSAPADALSAGQAQLVIFDDGVTPVLRVRYHDGSGIVEGDVALT